MSETNTPKYPQEAKFSKLNEIKPRLHCRNVYVRVINVKITEEDSKKNQQQKVFIIEGDVADETAFLPFRIFTQNQSYATLFKNAHANKQVVAFRNLKSEIFAGLHRLSVDRWGLVTAEPNQTISNPLSYYNTVSVKDLQPGENNTNVTVQIKSVTLSKQQGRRNQEYDVAEGVAADNTAQINFRVWGKSATIIEKGKTYTFINSLQQVQQETHVLGSGNKGRVLEAAPITIDTNAQLEDKSSVKYVSQVDTVDVKDLQPGEEGKNVTVLIESVTLSKQKGRNDQEFDVAKGVAVDATAKINFIVQGQKATTIEQGKTYTFINSLQSVIGETHFLKIGRKGKITEAQAITVNDTSKLEDKSSVNYTRVVVDDEQGNRRRNNNNNRNRSQGNRNRRNSDQGNNRRARSQNNSYRNRNNGSDNRNNNRNNNNRNNNRNNNNRDNRQNRNYNNNRNNNN